MKKLSVIVAVIFTIKLLPATNGFWGLRNINKLRIDTVLEKLNPTYQAWGINWSRTELSKGNFDWSDLEEAFEVVNQYNGIPVFVLSVKGAWAVPSGNQQAPYDIDRSTSLDDVIPDSGYSKDLYSYSRAFIAKSAELYSGKIYIRFVNESWINWKYTPANKEKDLDDYTRCLRTVHKACHDEESLHSLEVLVSHGSLVPEGLTLLKWYQVGDANPDKRDSIITLFQSQVERVQVGYYSDWNTVDYAMNHSNFDKLENWSNTLIENTDWVDFHDIHYHYKPRFLKEDIETATNAIIALGKTPKPYFVSEAAMNLYSAASVNFTSTFHANDMVRKWITAMINDVEGICTPMIGYPAHLFYGLFNEDSIPYDAYNSYHFIKQLIPFKGSANIIRQDSIIHVSFSDFKVDVIWKNALFDTDNNKISYSCTFQGEQEIEFYDVEGKEISGISDSNFPLEVGQEPIIVKWGTYTNVDKYLSTNILIYPNPAREYFIVQFSNNSPDKDFILFDNIGRKVIAIEEVKEDYLKIKTAHLSKGIYHFLIFEDKVETVGKLFLIN